MASLEDSGHRFVHILKELNKSAQEVELDDSSVDLVRGDITRALISSVKFKYKQLCGFACGAHVSFLVESLLKMWK